MTLDELCSFDNPMGRLCAGQTVTSRAKEYRSLFIPRNRGLLILSNPFLQGDLSAGPAGCVPDLRARKSGLSRP